MRSTRVLFGLLLVCAALSGCSKTSTGSSSDSKTGKGSEGAGTQASNGNKQSQGSDTVKIAADDQQRAGIRVAAVTLEQLPRTLSVAGQVQMDEQHTSHVGTLADGRITAVNVLPGAIVKRDQVLGELHSHAVHETVGALAQAFAAVDRQRAAVAFAKQAQERYHHLYSIQAASLEESQRSDQDLLQAQKMLVDSEANVHMEREHLSELLQVPPESLTPTNLYNRELIPIRSPTNGVVITQHVTVGQVVDTGFEAFVVSNLATVWVTASVNEKDLSLIHVGVPAGLTTQGYPDRVFTGKVAMIGDTLDPQTRTVPVRIVVPNPGTLLRPGMFATVRMAEPETRTAIFVPQDALQEINGMRVAFVTRDGTTFKARTVNVGTRSEGKVEITDGLSQQDRIVVNGAFMVKSELLKGIMGED